jgi:dephospho-CoA kinase
LAAPGPSLIGLSGAIASGKSEALAALERLGARTLSADAVVHHLLETERVRARLVERWGEGVAPGGRVDRARVGEIVFSDPAELNWLESLLHPLVAREVEAWRRSLPADVPLAVVEVPLLFEAGMEDLFDATLVVVAGRELRRQRAAARGTGALEGREARQLSEEEKAARATFVVRNTGTLADLEHELRELWPRLVEAREEGE